VELRGSSHGQWNGCRFAPCPTHAGLTLLLGATRLERRLRDDRFDFVFVNSETRGLPVPVASAWLGNHFFGRDFPLSFNNFADIFIGAAVDRLD
jgi:hypothetical protein